MIIANQWYYGLYNDKWGAFLQGQCVEPNHSRSLVTPACPESSLAFLLQGHYIISTVTLLKLGTYVAGENITLSCISIMIMPRMKKIDEILQTFVHNDFKNFINFFAH